MVEFTENKLYLQKITCFIGPCIGVKAPAANMYPTSLPKQFIAREGEAPAEPLRPHLYPHA